MKKLLIIGIILTVAYFGGVESGFIPAQHGDVISSTNSSDKVLAAAFENRRNNYQVQGGGEVIRILSDDNEESRHQRFIIRLASGQTLLVAHNIDIANRVGALKVGDYVEFNGEYEWNAQGGVIHWTHRDPQGRHVAGWVKHKGRTYQ